MALIKQFGLAGLYDNVQFGKGNGRIKFDQGANVFLVRNLADSSLVNARVAEPVNDSDAATKFYVDSVAQGLDPKEAVVAATNTITTNIDGDVSGSARPNDMLSLTYITNDDKWTLTGGVIDGVTLTANDRVLVKDATGADAVGNGIFVFAAGELTRSTDADNDAAGTGNEIGGGTFVFVIGGTVWENSGWVVTSPKATAVLKTDDIVFAQFSRVTGVYADDGLGKTGNKIYVRTDGTTTHIDNDNVAVKSSGTQYQTLISDGAGGTAAWNAVSLNETSATQNTLLRARGGLGAEVSAFADQSIYLSNLTGNSTTELSVGAANTVLRVDAGGNLGYGTVDLANSVSGILPITKIEVGTGTNEQVITTNGGANVWTEATELKGIEATRQVAFGASSVALGSALPANARVTSVKVAITSAYGASTSIIIGDVSDPDALSAADDIDPTSTGLYQVDLMHHYVNSTQITVGLSNSGSGTGHVILTYIVG
tara:strand:+ start:495 stop:1949 length:1455 start_codon:yes stop_codon:yes gene_type:complete